MTGQMTLEEFTRIAEIYGGDLSRWPESARARAAVFAGMPEAADVLRRESAFDRLLEGHEVLPPDAALEARIFAIPDRVRQDALQPLASPILLVWLQPAWAKALVLILCGVIGYAVGMIEIPAAEIDTALEQTASPAASQDNITHRTNRSIPAESVILGPTTLNEVIL